MNLHRSSKIHQTNKPSTQEQATKTPRGEQAQRRKSFSAKAKQLLQEKVLGEKEIPSNIKNTLSQEFLDESYVEDPCIDQRDPNPKGIALLPLVENSPFTEEHMSNLTEALQERIAGCRENIERLKSIPTTEKTAEHQEAFFAAKEELKALLDSQAKLEKSQLKPEDMSKTRRSKKEPRSPRQPASPRMSIPKRAETASIAPASPESKKEIKPIQPAKAGQLPSVLMAELKNKLKKELQD